MLSTSWSQTIGDRPNAAVTVTAIGAERKVQQLGRLLLGRGRPQVGAVQHPVVSFRPRIRLEDLGGFGDEGSEDLVGPLIGMLMRRILNHAGSEQGMAQELWGWCSVRSAFFTEAANSSCDSVATGSLGCTLTCSPSSRAAVRSSHSATPTRRQS